MNADVIHPAPPSEDTYQYPSHPTNECSVDFCGRPSPQLLLRGINADDPIPLTVDEAVMRDLESGRDPHVESFPDEEFWGQEDIDPDEKLEPEKLWQVRHRRHTARHAADEPANMVAPMPPIYVAAHALFEAAGLESTPDAVAQLVEVFVPCLRIMCERGYEPNGELWRRSGLFGVMEDVQKKFDRYWYRTWTLGRRHDDSGYDMINFTGMSLRCDPDSRFGVRGEPAPPRPIELEE